MSTSPPRRPTVAVLLALPLLAVLVLAGVGLATSLRAGARAERVQGLVPFTGALTGLVSELQRERRLSAGMPPGAAAGELAAARRAVDLAAAGELAAARRAVDRAAAGYRAAAVRVDASDRDRQVHRQLDAGLAQLAELAELRAAADGPAGAADPASVARRYTEAIGGLLAVGGEVGLREAGHDAGLLRAVTAASAFSRARELAAREQEVAARAVALGRVDPAEQLRLATIGGWQDALLGQFGSLASPGQRQQYDRAGSDADASRVAQLRRAALDGGPGPDLAAWSQATASRVERMRQVELGLAAEVARLAAQAAGDADRRATAYAATLALAACCTLVLVLVRRYPERGASRDGPEVADPADGRAAPGAARDEAAQPTAPGQPAVAADPGLADLARRGQELLDQQLELLGQIELDHTDPRLPGRLLQVDRLAVRARRNAHNLVVLAGGEPGRRWQEPAPLAEVVAVAVGDNRDAHRVDVRVAGELLVPSGAADDLANLLAELVANATAYSAPETRVRVSGQVVGSGYVLEVEDRGLGMTDEELEGVNRCLAGEREAGQDRRRGLGAWVAGRLAERHDLKVQLRRSVYGGVTALVFFPEHLTAAEQAAPPADRRGARARRDSEDRAAPDRGDTGAELARLPLRRYVTHTPEGPDRPLPKRAPHTSLAPDLAAEAGPDRPGAAPPRPPARSPEEVRSMLSNYRSGLERGRAAAARDLPADPDDDPPA